jgi:hypothetical protein
MHIVAYYTANAIADMEPDILRMALENLQLPAKAPE